MALGSCATINEVPVQRATVGPRAESIYNARFVRGYARLQTFDETSKFREDLARRTSDYLTRHPAIATSPRASQFRFERRVDLGMSKEEVTLLLGAPDAVTADPDKMKAAAEMFWPEVSKQAQEMWTYPSGWSLYFDADRLVDITVKGKPPIE